MKFRNKATGLTWEVHEENHIKRCMADSNYEVVEDKKTLSKSKKLSKSIKEGK